MLRRNWQLTSWQEQLTTMAATVSYTRLSTNNSGILWKFVSVSISDIVELSDICYCLLMFRIQGIIRIVFSLYITVSPVFVDARNNNTQALVTCMLCQKKLNICINKILIYNRKWFLPFISSQTHSKHHNYQATMCVLCSQWRHLFSTVGRIWQGEINKFTESLNVSSTWLKKQYFIMNSLKTSKTHTLSM